MHESEKGLSKSQKLCVCDFYVFIMYYMTTGHSLKSNCELALTPVFGVSKQRWFLGLQHCIGNVLPLGEKHAVNI